jgi:hypothetical protein
MEYYGLTVHVVGNILTRGDPFLSVAFELMNGSVISLMQ